MVPQTFGEGDVRADSIDLFTTPEKGDVPDVCPRRLSTHVTYVYNIHVTDV